LIVGGKGEAEAGGGEKRQVANFTLFSAEEIGEFWSLPLVELISQ